MIINVTAEVTFTYDTEDGLISTADEAVEDVWSMLANGDLSPNDFTIGYK